MRCRALRPLRAFSPCAAAVLLLLCSAAAPRAGAASGGPAPGPAPSVRDASAVHARLGPAWSLDPDPATGRPRRLAGGAIPWFSTSGGDARRPTDADILARARAFLSENADLLGIVDTPRPAEPAVVRADGGQLAFVHFEIAPGGVPVEGSRVTLVLSRGNLIYAHLVGTEPVAASPDADISDVDAIAIAIEAAAMPRGTLARAPDASTVFLREGGSHRLAWIVTLTAAAGPRRMVVRLDARDGRVLSVLDETVSACDPVPGGGAERRVLGGVRPTSPADAERPELLPHASVGTAVADVAGLFAPPPGSPQGRLDGPVVRVECVGCSLPVSPLAPLDARGDADFGSGGRDATGNGMATPADRASYFHAEAARRLASRYLDLPWFADPLVVRTNVDSACNAYWDGSTLTFFRSSARCGNTGEIRDVIQHEWGHGLDSRDGLPPPPLSVDGATGEAVADIVTILRSRDACIGEGFFVSVSDWPSAACSGVRDLDELAAGHDFGSPATLSTSNVASKCPASAYYRGPLGREGHCEGEILGQAFWHLARNLLDGVAYASGTPLPGGALPEEEAWQLLERLFFASRPIMASYAPSTMQSIGPSAHDAFLLADDTGDGLANGTPHAAMIHEAFAHHGIAETPLAGPTSPPCVAPADPLVTTSSPTDPSSGLPAVLVAWTDTGAATYEVLRADDAGDAFLPIAAPLPAGARSFLDRGVLPGRAYGYRVVASSAAGCRSPGATPVTGSAGPLLRLAAVVLDDSLLGNGDGLLEEGEQADIRFDLGNDGSGPASDLAVTLASTDPLVQVTVAGPISYGTIASGATVAGPSAFRLSALAGAPRHARLVVSGEAREGCLRAQHLLELAVVDLALASHRVEDGLGGDGDGAWEPGETVDLAVSLRDLGLKDATSVAGTLAFRAPVPGVTLVRTGATWPVIASGATAESMAPHFALRADAALGPRTPVPLRLDVTVQGRAHRSFNLDLTVGGMPQATIEWSSPGATTSPTPIVLQLTDDDGDGVITRCDIPDVVIGHWANNLIRAFSGANGALLWEVGVAPCIRFNAFGAFAGGDMDGDGRNEIVFGDLDEYLCALRDDGSLFWKTAAPVRSGGAGAVPHLFDLDGDGTVEVVSGHTLIDGRDGSVKWENAGTLSSRTLVADLDLDGSLEIIAGRSTWRADGSAFGATFEDMSLAGAAANMDDDRYPEILSLGSGATRGVVTVFEHDGSIKWQRADLPATGGTHGPPCVGDFDRDGRAEIAMPRGTVFIVLDDDSTELWSAPILDASGASGCSVFDFDFDGVPEIVYRDESFVTVYDGLSGQVLWQQAASSGTGYEYPQVVDVDGDGLAEILVTGSVPGRVGQLHAFGHSGFPSGRGVWNQEDYSVTHVEDDGSITPAPLPRWLTGNDFRGQSSVCPCDGPAPAFTFRSDCDATTCFTALVAGGRLPLRVEWDFGDGSPLVTGPTPCHVYAGPGNYPVILRVHDANTCVVETGQIVRIGDPLDASLVASPACAGADSCFTATVTGGVGPHDVTWDFGDGSPQATGLSTCHAFAGGSFLVTLLVRDARGCLADASVLVDAWDPASIPEISPRGSAQPLRLSRPSATDLRLTFDAAGVVAGVYQGTIAGLWATGYDHAATPACRVATGSAILPAPSFDAYYLVAGSACEAPRFEGSYGMDSFGRQRPSASALGTPICP